MTGARRRYAIAAGMVVVAVALGAVFGVVVARALSGYAIDPVADPQQTVVTAGDRPSAVWAAPDGSTTVCTAVDAAGRDVFTTGLSVSMSITDGGRTWERVGVVEGEPGTPVTLSCSADGSVTIGVADNPRLLRYVVLGVTLGGSAALLVVVAFVLALVTALRRPPRTPG